jgi:type II secretory pathway component PulL
VLVEQQRREALRAQMTQVFSQALPAARMTADPAAQLAAEMGRLQRAGGAQGGPFAVLAAVAPRISQGSRYRLAALDWRLGTLELEIATADVAALDALRESLAAAGLAVELTGVTPAEAGVRGRLRVRAAA